MTAGGVRLTVLGGCGAWPGAGQACSGYLLESAGYRVLLDPGYAVLPRLLSLMPATAVDAVVATHGHPDHCADLNPLLRARALGDEPVDPLPVYAPHDSLRAVLALDDMRAMASAADSRDLADGDVTKLGPFSMSVAELPHHVTNVGIRLEAGSSVLAYTGDSGPDRAVVELARAADLFLVEATYPDSVPDEDAPYLCDATQAVDQGTAAGVGRIMLTHWWPTAARSAYDDVLARVVDGNPPTSLASPGAVVELDQRGSGTTG